MNRYQIFTLSIAVLVVAPFINMLGKVILNIGEALRIAPVGSTVVVALMLFLVVSLITFLLIDEKTCAEVPGLKTPLPQSSVSKTSCNVSLIIIAAFILLFFIGEIEIDYLFPILFYN